MIFSYYFDVEKTHRLNCGMDVESFIVNSTTQNVTLQYNAYIEEIKEGSRLRRESKRGTFTFALTQQTSTLRDYDFDFLRTRVDEDAKWIFEIRNNRNPNQQVLIGLITHSANKNPLGLEMIYKENRFDGDLKANVISRLNDTYKAPVLEQTVVRNLFSTPGFPNGFTARSATYNSQFQLYDVASFEQVFPEAIQKETVFELSVDIAPNTLNTETNDVFSLDIRGVGEVFFKKDGVHYKKEGEVTSQFVTYPSSTVLQTSFFFNSGMTTNAKMIVSGDGKGEVTIRYGGLTLKGSYNHQKPITAMKYKGALKKITSTEPMQTILANPRNWVDSKVDNLIAIYRK